MSRVNVADILQKRCQYESHLPHNARKPRNSRKADKSKGFGVFGFKIFLKILSENTTFCVHSVHESVHDCTRKRTAHSPPLKSSFTIRSNILTRYSGGCRLPPSQFSIDRFGMPVYLENASCVMLVYVLISLMVTSFPFPGALCPLVCVITGLLRISSSYRPV